MQNENFTIVDTKALQIKSLLHFAEALGYVPVDRTRLSRGFYYEWWYEVYEYPVFKSLEYIVRAHNIIMDQYKLVRQVKLQRDKKEPDGVKCQNHMIRLTPRGEELYTYLRSL
ncbi:TPA: hypothetical protein ACOAY7_002934 [Vibrio cholerae]|nr:hypothetical protein 1992IndM4_0120 [Vibrio phage ICP1]QVV97426.1 hypothetical protein 2017DRC106_0120 [Vibrio phage ICP1]QVV97653.1 hypothetical protein 2017DRC32_0120 [Vibrio phage ICP1]QVV97880.1 hypothetical protein 2017DRC48_0120 [Vibrio phage ICP1]QVV98107.1 hypothetical protein 2017DRC55_0120 [Vibrio phage ICP1]